MVGQGGKASNKAMHYMYNAWSDKAIGRIKKYNKNIADAEDIVHDAFVVLENHIRNKKYKPTGKLEYFFYGICKWSNISRLQRERKKKVVVPDDGNLPEKVDGIDPEVKMIKQQWKDVVTGLLNMLQKTCRDILRLYMEGYSMKDIAEELDLENADKVRYKLFACKKRMRKLITDNPSLNDYLKRRNEI